MGLLKGFYLVILTGTSDGETILYCDGVEFFTHGSAEPVPQEDFFRVSEKPIELKDIKA